MNAQQKLVIVHPTQRQLLSRMDHHERMYSRIQANVPTDRKSDSGPVYEVEYFPTVRAARLSMSQRGFDIQVRPA